MSLLLQIFWSGRKSLLSSLSDRRFWRIFHDDKRFRKTQLSCRFSIQYILRHRVGFFFFFLASFWPMQRHAVLLFHCNELLKKFPACGLAKSQMFSLHNKSSTITATSIKFINAIQTKMSHQI